MADNPTPTERRLTNKEAAEHLGVRPGTLENWRKDNRGPRYLKVGARVLYRQSDLDAFVREVETVDSRKAGH